MVTWFATLLSRRMFDSLAKLCSVWLLRVSTNGAGGVWWRWVLLGVMCVWVLLGVMCVWVW